MSYYFKYNDIIVSDFAGFGVVSAEIFSPSVQAMPIDMCLETVKQKTQQVMKNSEVLEKQGN